MDPADDSQLRKVLATQGAMLTHHEGLLKELSENLRHVSLTVQNLVDRHDTAALAATAAANAAAALSSLPVPTPPPTPREPRLPPPERYDGRPEGCREFITQCTLVFSLQPTSFSTEQSRVAYITTLLTGRALSWATAEWEKGTAICADSQLFIAELRKVFDHTRVLSTYEAGRRLTACRQGDRTVADYSVEFRTLARETGWEERAVVVLYAQGLSEVMKDELSVRELPEQLDELVDLSRRVDNRRRERDRERGSARGARPRSMPGVEPPSGFMEEPTYEEPMQLGAAHLSQTERQRRQREGRCLYCGRMGHLVATCPEKPGNGRAR